MPEEKKLHVGCPNIGDINHFNSLVAGLFERRWFSNNGVLVQELERTLSDYLGVRHCISVCNATIGLQVVCKALGLTGEVILPAYTFVATPHSLFWQGVTPVFADVDPHRHLLDPARVETLITERTTAILGVHTWGRACHPDGLQALADKYSLALYFDAAHAFGCSHGGRMIGNFGRCEVFSFHATKFFNTFEGGCITTNDDELASRLRLMINFGFSGLDQVDCLGTNGKLSEIHAAMGLASFRCLDQTIETNRQHHERYKRNLFGVRGLHVCENETNERNNYQYVVLELAPGEAGLSRDELVRILHAKNIMARRYFFPGCHRMAPYRDMKTHARNDLRNTDHLCGQVLVMPTGTAVEPSDIDRACDIIIRALDPTR